MSIHVLTFSTIPAVADAVVAKLDAERPGKFTATRAFSLADFEAAAVAEKDKIAAVVLAATLTAEQNEGAKKVIKDVLGSKVKVVETSKSVIQQGGTVDPQAVLRNILEQLDSI